MLTESTYGLSRPRPAASLNAGLTYLDGVLASTIFDLDATIAASYGGSGTTWANLVAAPADANAQTAYDLYLGDGATGTTYPTFNGTAGNAAAYWTTDGGDYFRLKSGTNTNFLRDLHKAGSSWWIALAHHSTTGIWGGARFISTFTGFSGGQYGLYVRPTAAETLDVGSADNGSGTGNTMPGTPFSVIGNYLTIISHDGVNNVTTWWNNSATGSSAAHSFTSTTNATGVFTLLANSSGAADLVSTGRHRFYSFAMGNEYLNNTKAASIIAHLNTRHSRTYA